MKSDGMLEIIHRGDDCGQGLNAALTQIAAEGLSVPMEKVRVISRDSWQTRYDSSTRPDA